MRSPGVISLLSCAVLCHAGCTVALQTPAEQCVEDADCAARGGELAGTVCIDDVCREPPDSRWACVGHVEPTPIGESFTASIRLVDLLAAEPVTDASVQLCKKLDPLCSVPVQTLAPDADGAVSAGVQSDFRGFFSIEAPGYVPTLFFIDTGGVTGALNVAMFTPEASNALNQTITPDIDPEGGFVNVVMHDCEDQRAPGVHFEIAPDDGVTPFYAIGSSVSGTATETDVTGNGGFINVPPGTVTLTATLAETGEVLSVETTLIRKATLTYQAMRPTSQDGPAP